MSAPNARIAPEAVAEAGAAAHGIDTLGHPFTKLALGCIPLTSPVRWWAIRVVTSPAFKRCILLCIVANSATLGMVDHSNVDPYTYEPLVEGSWRNMCSSAAESVFLGIFTVEFLLKIVALGLVADSGCYLRDPWNVLDFAVVAGGLLSLLPSVPSVGMLRTLRVLRPLRSIVAVPRLKMQVTSLLSSLPRLLNLLVLAFFFFIVFGVFGLQMWRGLFDRRCRLTPFPVALRSEETGLHLAMMRDYAAGSAAALAYAQRLIADRASYPFCSDPANSTTVLPVDSADWTAATSPWATPRPCVWPLATNQTRVCNPYDDWSTHGCLSWQTCGSNYDRFGNPRFADPNIMRSGVYVEELDWGFTHFNNIFAAFGTIFQCITMEGWILLAYRVMDAYSAPVAVLYFVLLIGIGTYFLLSIMLAILEEAFDRAKAEEQRRAHAEKNKPPAQGGQQREKSSPVPKARCPAAARLCSTRPAVWWRSAGQRCVTAVASPFHRLATHPAFDNAALFVIVLNTAALALDTYPLDPARETVLENINFGLTLVYVLEMFIKLVGIGPVQYTMSRWNCFDGAIVLANVLELILMPPSFGDSESESGVLYAFRLLRLLRLVNLARKWKALRLLLETMRKTLPDILNFMLLLSLFLYVYALIGMQLFANRMRFDPETGDPLKLSDPAFHEVEPARANFDSLLWAFITVFRVVAEEDWNAIWYDAWRGAGWHAFFYFSSCIVIGNFVLLSLFVAILLSNFESKRLERDSQASPTAECKATDAVEDASHPLPDGETAKQRDVGPTRPSPPSHSPADSPKHSPQSEGTASGAGGDSSAGGLPSVAPPQQASFEDFVSEVPPARSDTDASRDTAWRPGSTRGGVDVLPAVGEGGPTDGTSPPGSTDGAPASPRSARQDDKRGMVQEGPQPALADVAEAKREEKVRQVALPRLEGVTFGAFGPRSRFRLRVAAVVQAPSFDSVILVCIVASSALLAIESPFLDPNSELARTLHVADLALTSIFALEMFAKVFVYGLFRQPQAYLRSPWNALDGCIVVVSILSLSFGSVAALKSLRTLRTLRALRPLRVISRLPGLRLVVDTLLRSGPAVINVSMICLVIYVTFAIVGVFYFKGSFSACSGQVFEALPAEQVRLVEDPVPYAALSAQQRAWVPNATYAGATSKAVCLWLGATWTRQLDQSFDDFPNAMLTLLEMTTTEGWPGVMEATVDATGIDMQPKRDQAPEWAFFSIGFIVIGAFFMLNLFVGVVVETYSRISAESSGSALLTPAQRQWVKIQEVMMKTRPHRRPKRPRGPRGCFFDLVTDPRFDKIILVCILANTLVMASNFFGEPEWWTMTTTYLNLAFAGIFTLEAGLKVCALGTAYFRDKWNLFDLAIVVGTNGGIATQWVTGVVLGPVTTGVRTFRIARLLRLIKRASTLRVLFDTLLLCLPGLANIGGLLCLIVFIFAVMAVQLFAYVEVREPLDQHVNFQTFWSAALFLLRAITGEDWNSVMHALTARPPGCVQSTPFDPSVCGFTERVDCTPLRGCGSWVAIPFLVVFTMTVSFVFLNLFVAIILDGFSHSQEGNDSALTERQFEAFVSHWANFDEKATCFIPVSDLEDFFQDLPPPMGFGPGQVATRAQLQRRVASLQIPTYVRRGAGTDTVFFTDVALALGRRLVNEAAARDGDTAELPPDHVMNARWARKFRRRKDRHVSAVNPYTASQLLASRIIEDAFRTHQVRSSAAQALTSSTASAGPSTVPHKEQRVN